MLRAWLRACCFSKEFPTPRFQSKHRPQPDTRVYAARGDFSRPGLSRISDNASRRPLWCGFSPRARRLADAPIDPRAPARHRGICRPSDLFRLPYEPPRSLHIFDQLATTRFFHRLLKFRAEVHAHLLGPLLCPQADVSRVAIKRFIARF